jgi:hypothetical protein
VTTKINHFPFTNIITASPPPNMPFKKKRQSEADSDGEAQVTKKAKSENKPKKDLSKGKDAEGNPYWEVGFLTISTCQARVIH